VDDGGLGQPQVPAEATAQKVDSTDHSRATSRRLCPSAPMSGDALLHGIVTPSGRIGHVTPAIEARHLPPLPDRRPAESSLRFASPCVEECCQNWSATKDECSLIESICSANPDIRISVDVLPRCAIRSHCVWFLQQRGSACAACSKVVTRTTQNV
jgi:hypothetical protein